MMILMLKWDTPSVNPVIQLVQTQTRLLTDIDAILKYYFLSSRHIIHEKDATYTPPAASVWNHKYSSDNNIE